MILHDHYDDDWSISLLRAAMARLGGGEGSHWVIFMKLLQSSIRVPRPKELVQ